VLFRNPKIIHAKAAAAVHREIVKNSSELSRISSRFSVKWLYGELFFK